jgi:hypothetical protein
LREWAGILVFGTFSIQCAARHMDISAFVPLQDLGFGRRAARLAVQCVFRNEEIPDEANVRAKDLSIDPPRVDEDTARGII